MNARRGIPFVLAGLALFAYQALAPGVPHERSISYRYPAATAAGPFEVTWREGNDAVEHARFAVAAGQRQSSHTVLLADGDYLLDAELPGGVVRSRRVHLDAASFTVVLE